MSESIKILKSILGERGFDTLEKAIFHNRSRAVSDPLELYLPLMVVPRAILSWLVQHIKPMKINELKELPFPGKEDIKIHILKRDLDQYDAEFVQSGRIIHEFKSQGIPSISGHLMSIGEMYDSFGEDKKPSEPIKQTSEPLATEIPANFDMVRHMVSVAGIQPKEDVEAIKWTMAHANVKELTSIIGKLIDALASKKIKSDEFEEGLDKESIPESKAELLEKPYQSDAQRRWAHTSAGTKALGGKEAVAHWDKESKGKDLPEQVAKDEWKPNTDGSFTHTNGTIIKPVDQNKWATHKPKQFPGHSTAIGYHNSLEEAKAFKYKHNINKEEVSESIDKGEMPKGAGQPHAPAKPKEPLAPVPPGHNPVASAAKQAQASGRSGYMPPKTPGAPQPKNPTSNPKTPQAPKQVNYFKNILNKQPVQKFEIQTTETGLYKTVCKECGTPEFKKDQSGNPVFSPCACFLVLKKDEDGKPKNFVNILRKSNGSFALEFDPNVDEDTIRLFALTMKSRLLIKKKFGV